MTRKPTNSELIHGRPDIQITRSTPLPPQQASREFRVWPRTVSRAFRERLLELYPALQYHEHAQAYLRIALYVLLNGKPELESGEILLPFHHVQALVEDWRHTKGHAALDWIEKFSQDVFPLHVTEYRYTENKARTVQPELHKEIFCMIRGGQMRGKDGERVDFLTGALVSGREQRKRDKEYENFLRHRALVVVTQAAEDDHPAHELLDYLTQQSPNYLQRVLDTNWPAVRQAVDDLPQTTEAERARKMSTTLLLGRLDLFRQTHYITVPKTPRIFAAGTNIHQLPREIRKIALKGGTELDLSACQLAVVAKLWNLDELQSFLASGGSRSQRASIWKELLEWLALPASNKPILKITIYSILFGMGKRRLRSQLANGDYKSDGIGATKAKHFFQHPLISALLAARERELDWVQACRGGRDAFGHWWSTADPNGCAPARRWYQRDPRARSVLAAIVQSYELKLMTATLPILKANPQIYMLSWLHDGVTLQFGNHTKKKRQIAQLQAGVRAAALEMGVETELQDTDL